MTTTADVVRAKKADYNAAYRAANREAIAVYSRAYYAANREAIAARNRDYQAANYRANREKILGAKRRAHVLDPWSARRSGWKRRGINVVEAESLLRSHSGLCGLCGANTPGGNRGWQVDHDHKTGHVRGVLCVSCNTALGAVERAGWVAFRDYLTKGVKSDGK